MNLGFPEMIFLFLFALILFGPKKLPEIGRQIGRALNEFKRASNEFRSQIESEISNLDVEPRQQILPPTQPPPGAMPILDGSGLTPDQTGRVLTPAPPGTGAMPELTEGGATSGEFRSQIESEISNLDVEPRQQILPPTEPPPGAMPILDGSGLTPDQTGRILTPELPGTGAMPELTEGGATSQPSHSPELNSAVQAPDA